MLQTSKVKITTIKLAFQIVFQEERRPKKPVVEDFEEFDYNDLYEEIPVGNEASNMTEYEVRLDNKTQDKLHFNGFIPTHHDYFAVRTDSRV